MNDSIPPAFLKGSIFMPVWSGKKIEKMYSSYGGCGRIGEVWLTSTVSDAEAMADVDGTVMPFGEYLRLCGCATPPLVKIIDAAAPLSIQVHPDEIAAAKHGGISKSEIWYVLEADEGATLLWGSRDGVSGEELRHGITDGTIDTLMKKIPVNVGDVFMIPPGMIHSLGGGVTVLEVQDRCGTTYRVKDIAGNRETHPAESIDSLRVYSSAEASAIAFTDHHRLLRTPLPGDVLATTDGYVFTHYAAEKAGEMLSVPPGAMMFCNYGGGYAGERQFSPGDAVFFGEYGEIVPDGGTSLLFAG